MSRSLFITITDWLERLVTPPCRGAAIFVWLGFAAFLFFDKSGALWHGDLNDPDDYLYLVQAIDWLHGQNWLDLIQHRIDPPQGTFIHYSHLLSAFYATIIAVLRPFFGIINASLVTAAILPLAYFALFLFMLRKLAQIIINPAWGDFTAIVITVSPVVVSQFWAGAVRHHGIEITLAIIALYAIARMVMAPKKYKWPLIAGFALAMGLALGLEIIAIVGLFSLCIGIWAAVEKDAAARSGLLFSLTLFIASIIFLLLTRGTEHVFDIIIPAFSIVYVIFTGCITFCFASLFVISDKLSISGRCVMAGLIAGMTGALFLYWFPELRMGPYGGADPALTKLIFFSEPEAWPAMRADLPLGQRLLPAIWPALAIASNFFIFWQTQNRTRRWQWGIILVSLTACTALAEFYQTRFFDFAQALAVFPLVAIIRHDWEIQTLRHTQNIWRIIRLSFVIVIGPATFLMATSHFNNTASDNEHSLASAKGCDMHHLADLLNDKSDLGSHEQIIINTLNEGPELLFRTEDSVLAGPYHMNVQGNIDAFNFFTAPNAGAARTIAQKRHATLVVACTTPVQLRAYKMGDQPEKIFIQQLIAGQIPDWLTPIQPIQLNDLIVFKIKETN